MVEKAICLISGGIDSCIAGYIAKNEGFNIYSLSFNYGQKHKKELECAKIISNKLKVKKHIIIDINLHKIGGSALFDKSLKISKNKDILDIGKSIPNTYVPARNTIFLSYGLAFAEVTNSNVIYIGVNSTDYSGYPDCRPEYIKAYQKMANLATKKGIEDFFIEIKTPLINLSKAEIIKKGLELNVPFEKTWSCYLGKNNPCGKCESCLLRLKGFKEAGFKDPLNYEFLPEWYL